MTNAAKTLPNRCHAAPSAKGKNNVVMFPHCASCETKVQFIKIQNVTPAAQPHRSPR